MDKAYELMSEKPFVVSVNVTIHRSELIPGGNGSRLGFSNDYPGKQFLVMPATPSKLKGQAHE